MGRTRRKFEVPYSSLALADATGFFSTLVEVPSGGGGQWKYRVE